MIKPRPTSIIYTFDRYGTGPKIDTSNTQDLLRQAVFSTSSLISLLNSILINGMHSTISEEMQKSVSSLNTNVQTLLEKSEDISQRLAGIEATSMCNPMSTDSDATSLLPASDSDIKTLSISEEDSRGHLGNVNQFGLDPNTELNLQKSRVYRRSINRHSMSSLFSSRSAGSGWSKLSGISLAQVSNISVLSLPVNALEIWGSDHYMPSYDQRTQDNKQRPTYRGWAGERLLTGPPSHRSILNRGLRSSASPEASTQKTNATGTSKAYGGRGGNFKTKKHFRTMKIGLLGKLLIQS